MYRSLANILHTILQGTILSQIGLEEVKGYELCQVLYSTAWHNSLSYSVLRSLAAKSVRSSTNSVTVDAFFQARQVRLSSVLTIQHTHPISTPGDLLQTNKRHILHYSFQIVMINHLKLYSSGYHGYMELVIYTQSLLLSRRLIKMMKNFFPISSFDQLNMIYVELTLELRVTLLTWFPLCV